MRLLRRGKGDEKEITIWSIKEGSNNVVRKHLENRRQEKGLVM